MEIKKVPRTRGDVVREMLDRPVTVGEVFAVLIVWLALSALGVI
jgi:hypothetical protein